MHGSIEAILRGGQFKKLTEKAMLVIRNKTGLKRVEIEVLYFLARFPKQNTMKDICNHLQMNKGHISTVLDSLNKQEYIVQQQAQDDRRYVHYTLTSKGNEVATHMDVAWEKMTEKMMEGLTESEIQIFEMVASQMEKNIEQMLNEKEQWNI